MRWLIPPGLNLSDVELLVPQAGEVQCLNIFASMFSCFSWNLFSTALCHYLYPCKNKN